MLQVQTQMVGLLYREEPVVLRERGGGGAADGGAGWRGRYAVRELAA